MVDIYDQLFVASMLEPLTKVRTESNMIDLLVRTNDLLHNIFLIDPAIASYEVIQDFLSKQILTYDPVSNLLSLLPLSISEYQSSLMKHFTTTIPRADGEESPVQIQVQSLSDKPKRLLNEDATVLLEYLFIPFKDTITFDEKLSLYCLLSEEYRKMLQQRDITSLAMLGRQTVMLIINEVYEKVNKHPLLQSIPKEQLIILIRKFFNAIQQMIRSFYPV